MKYITNFFIIILLCSCANMVVPTGGKKDEKIPTLQSTNLQKINFKETLIKLQFDEYITIHEPTQSITIQPNHTTFKTEVVNKAVYIKLDSNLHDNTTYTLNIDNGIKDLNENNSYNFCYSFATGGNIDTNYTEYVIDNFNKYKNLKIGLTLQQVDSIELLKFDYLYSIKTGSVRIDGLNHLPYKIWIFTDKNSDKIPDLYCPIYYDTIAINSSHKIELNNWINFSNEKVKLYNTFTKIYKPISNIESYGKKNIYYIDQDSALFLNKNSDTLPKLNLIKEIYDKINSNINAINTGKDYIIIIDKCGFINLKLKEKYNYTEDGNYIYIESKTRLDSIGFKFEANQDSFSFYTVVKYYVESNKLSLLKINKIQKNNTLIMVMFKDEKKIFTKKMVLDKDQIFYLSPGKYYVEFYKTEYYEELSFNLQKLKRSSTPIIKQEIILKPNWDEVLQLLF